MRVLQTQQNRLTMAQYGRTISLPALRSVVSVARTTGPAKRAFAYLEKDMYAAHDTERFWSKVVKSEGCWEWSGARNQKGYGLFWWEGRMAFAHRVSYLICRDSIPTGMFVCHRCDNPSCVRPDHLFIGTVNDNNKDRHVKGRYETGDRHWTHFHPDRIARGEHNGMHTHPESRPWGDRAPARRYPETRPYGERHGMAKLNWEIVRYLRQRHAAGGVSCSALAREYGVNRGTVASIIRQDTWKE